MNIGSPFSSSLLPSSMRLNYIVF